MVTQVLDVFGGIMAIVPGINLSLIPFQEQSVIFIFMVPARGLFLKIHVMILIIVCMAIFFIALGFILTEYNAKHLLAGYNTMNEAERKKVDLKGLVRFFRRFHIFLGVTFLILGLVSNYLFTETTTRLALLLYPILAYVYLVWQSSKFYKP